MISAVILTHDNEGTIERTIKSLAWCDEVVVIDDYSKDKTVHKGEALNARVMQHHLNNDFSAQRNFGLTCVKGEWVLYVDSDEVVPPSLANEIKQIVQSTKHVGFFLKRQDILFGKKLLYGETANVRLLRFAKKDAGRWERPVHEVWNIPGPTDTLIHPLEHNPHPTMTEFIADINHYSTINAELMRKEGKHVSWFEMFSFPVGKFIQNYIIRQGFRDGVPGTILAFMMSFHSFLTRGKLYASQKS